MKIGIRTIVQLHISWLSAAGVLLIILLVGYRTNNLVREQTRDYYDLVLIKVEEQIEYTFHNWESILLPKSHNRLLVNSLINEAGRGQYLSSIFNELKETDYGTNVHIGLFDFKLTPIKTDSSWLTKMPELMERDKLKTIVVDQGTIYSGFNSHTKPLYYILALPLFYQEKVKGVLFVAFEWDRIWQKMLKQHNDVSLTLFYQSKIIARSKVGPIDGVSRTFTFPARPKLSLTTIISRDLLTEPGISIVKEIVLIAFVIIGFQLLITVFFVAERITRPIVSLQKAVTDVSMGQWERVTLKHGGKEVMSLADSFNHMTEQLQRNQAAQQTAKEKAEEQAKLVEKMALFAQSFPFPILSIDNNGRIETANAATDSAFLKHVIRRQYRELFINLPGNFLNEIRQNSDIFFHHQTIGSRYFLFTFQWIRQLEVVHVFGTDISNLKQAEEKAHEKQLWEALYYRAGEILHEVGNKTLVLVGYLDELRYLQEEMEQSLEDANIEKMNETLAAFREEIKNSFDTLNVIQEIVDRMSDRKRKAIEKSEINLFDLVSKSIEDEKFKAPTVAFRLNCPNGLRAVHCLFDKIHFGQILSNLLKNAEYAIRENEDPRIAVNIGEKETFYVIDVSDNGAGIAAKDQQRIFLDGYTTKGSEGKGIGLALCKNLAIENNSDLTLDWSQIDEGSRFRLQINKMEESEEKT